jgi:hypothetical protein
VLQLPPAVQALVYGGNAWDEMDVFTFFLFDGSDVRRWTSAGHDITCDADGDGIEETYLAGVVGVKAGDVYEETGTSVATMDFELAGDVEIGGAPITQAAMSHAFGGARVVARTLVLSGPHPGGTLLGGWIVFDGLVGAVDPGTWSTRLQAKSPMARSEQGKGARLVGSSCPFTVYDSECAATVQEAAATVAAGSSVRQVNLTSLPATSGLGARVLFTSGPLAGVGGVVRGLGVAWVLLDEDLPQAPAAGATCMIRRGCDHALAGCALLSNLIHFGGAPASPSRDLWTPEN